MDTTTEATTETLAKDMVHSLTTFGVEGIRQTSAEKLVVGGVRTVLQLIASRPETLQTILGATTGERLLTDFNACLKKASATQWIQAWPGWPRGFGERKITATLEWQADVECWPTTSGTPKSMSASVLAEIVACVPK